MCIYEMYIYWDEAELVYLDIFTTLHCTSNYIHTYLPPYLFKCICEVS